MFPLLIISGIIDLDLMVRKLTSHFMNVLAPSARRHTQRRVRHITESSLRYPRSFAPLSSSFYNSNITPISPQLRSAKSPASPTHPIPPTIPQTPLHYATLRSASLRYASLRFASLRIATLRFAPLRSASLRSTSRFYFFIFLGSSNCANFRQNQAINLSQKSEKPRF